MAEFEMFQSLEYSPEEQHKRADEFYRLCKRRRSIREFSSAPIDRGLLEKVLLTAASAPSGANRQPWQFVVVTDPAIKKKIRMAAEAEEKKNYEQRMPREWLEDLAPLGTTWRKEFLETAPALIVVFARNYDLVEEKPHKNYYVKESVGIAVGFLLLALHNAGLVALTHTPSPMDFLVRLLQRPENERAYLLVPVGYPKPGAAVPAISRKALNDVCTWLEGPPTEHR